MQIRAFARQILTFNCNVYKSRFPPKRLSTLIASKSGALQLLSAQKTKHISSVNKLSLVRYSTMAPINTDMDPEKLVDKLVSENKVMVFSKSFCPFCHQVKDLLHYERIGFEALELDLLDNGLAIQDTLQHKTAQKTVPNVFFNGKFVGGSNKMQELQKNGELFSLLNEKTHNYEYDLVVIGGGSGGLAASKEAARLGAKVAVCDFVTPTPIGTTWGLGGTCVNVGCIPKKLMHQAAILGHNFKDAVSFGWQNNPEIGHDWEKMVDGIQAHIGSLNWGYKVALRDKNIQYLNSFAKFTDSHTIQAIDKRGREKILTADNFLVAVGGRPRYPDIPGAKEYGITSDDIFSLQHAPGKTLLIGASYISLECAGFLAGLGYDVTVMVRSIFLRGFDQQMANKAAEYMKKNGVKFIRGAVPTEVQRISEGEPGKLKVIAKTTDGNVYEDEFNTVVFAIGRDPCTSSIGLDNVGVNLAKNGKIIADKAEKSNVDNIFAIGDVLNGGLELTPVAVQAGKLLARRLYGNKTDLTDYETVPTTVFTPLEYGCIGLSEEAALENYGDNDIEIYHSSMLPLEFTVPHRPENDCYVKLICIKSQRERVVGFHYLGPNAGEVTQGYALGMKLGATKEDFNNLIGIHPVCAEVFTTLNVTKKSGKDVSAQGC